MVSYAALNPPMHSLKGSFQRGSELLGGILLLVLRWAVLKSFSARLGATRGFPFSGAFAGWYSSDEYRPAKQQKLRLDLEVLVWTKIMC